MIVIGVDPGISGAIAFLRVRDEKLVVYDMPVLINVKKQRKDLDAETLARIIASYVDKYEALAVVEQVSARTYRDSYGQVRGQGAAASFKFGKVTGIVHGILAALKVKMVEVHPAVWKSLMGLTSEKHKSIARAVTLFPRNSASFGRLKDNGRAEAALIAWFGKSRFCP